jgi:hypothetical protein
VTRNPSENSDHLFHGPEESEVLLTADFSKGEQFWKFWTTPKVTVSDGEVVRIKILSKKTKDGNLRVICLTEIENGNKIIWVEDWCASDVELEGFARGIQAVVTHMVGHEAVFERVDFSRCLTYEQWNYKFREGTTVKLWNSEDGSSVRGNM